MYKEKRREIRLGPMTKALIPTENNKKQLTRSHQNVDYTMIAGRLRTVSWSNNSHPTGMVKPYLKGTNLHTHRKSSVINRTWHDRNIVNDTDFHKDHAGHTRKASRISKTVEENCGKGVGNF